MADRKERFSVGAFVTIYRQGAKGIFTADFFYRGKHRRQSLKTTNLKVARQRAANFDARLADGEELTSPKPTTVADAVALFIGGKPNERMRPRSLQKYKSFLETFTAFAESRPARRLSQVTPDLINKFGGMHKPTHSARSMHNKAVMLKAFLQWCKIRGRLKTNPMSDMCFKRPPINPRGGPTIGQVEQILAATTEPRRSQLAALAFTGMHKVSFAIFRVEDIDLRNNWIKIVSREGAETKTGLSRKVPIHPRLRAVLEHLQSDPPGGYSPPA